jgi:hypothetical protein
MGVLVATSASVELDNTARSATGSNLEKRARRLDVSLRWRTGATALKASVTSALRARAPVRHSAHAPEMLLHRLDDGRSAKLRIAIRRSSHYGRSREAQGTKAEGRTMLQRKTGLIDGRKRAEAAPKRRKRSSWGRVRRFVRKLFGMSKIREPQPSKPPEGPVFIHLWRAAAAASYHGHKLSIHQRNVLLFQMGKVASSALQAALINGGINCFHCHSLRHDEEAHRLSHLFQARPNVALAARDLTMLSKHTALNMLARWYRVSEVPPDRKLKVITLTRDPVTRFVSHLLQRIGYDAKRLIDWHREFAGSRTDGSDLGAAAGDMFRQVARIVVEAKPSVDVEVARVNALALAMKLDPPSHSLQRALHPLWHH